MGTANRFGTYRDFPGWEGAQTWVVDLIEKHDARSVLELGAGANPTISRSALSQGRLASVEYTVSDIDEAELRKGTHSGDILVIDMASVSQDGPVSHTFDLIFSRMVNEHVPDIERYFRGIWQSLPTGGVTAHAFACRGALPFLANSMMPENVSRKVLARADPHRDMHMHDKFQAYYDNCIGPTQRALRFYESLGFNVLSYRGYFGHAYYRHVSRFLQYLEDVKSTFLSAHPLPALCSYAVVELQRIEV